MVVLCSSCMRIAVAVAVFNQADVNAPCNCLGVCVCLFLGVRVWLSCIFCMGAVRFLVGVGSGSVSSVGSCLVLCRCGASVRLAGVVWCARSSSASLSRVCVWVYLGLHARSVWYAMLRFASLYVSCLAQVYVLFVGLFECVLRVLCVWYGEWRKASLQYLVRGVVLVVLSF